MSNRAKWKQTKKEFGEQIMMLRKEKGLSVEDAAVKSLINIRLLQKLEQGKGHISFMNINLLAKFYNKKIVINLEDE